MNQWSTRPDDERFETLAEMHDACLSYRRRSAEKPFNPKEFGIYVTSTGDIKMRRIVLGSESVPSEFTHYAFTQFASLLKVPAGYLRTALKKNPQLAADNLNYGIENYEGNKLVGLVQSEGTPESPRVFMRATTSSKYARFWNHEITGLIHRNLEPQGWKTPPARPSSHSSTRVRIATKDDVSKGGKFGISVKEGDEISPAGLYASDHDCFIFMVDETRPIDLGNGEILFRGFMVKNSEVGDSSLVVTTFLYEGVCGNHIVWNAHQVRELRVRHLGDPKILAGKFNKASIELRSYATADEGKEIKAIRVAKTHVIGKTREDVIEYLFGGKFLSRSDSETVSKAAEEHESIHGDPRTTWGVVSAVTRISQNTPHADEREVLDRAAARILTAAL